MWRIRVTIKMAKVAYGVLRLGGYPNNPNALMLNNPTDPKIDLT